LSYFKEAQIKHSASASVGNSGQRHSPGLGPDHTAATQNEGNQSDDSSGSSDDDARNEIDYLPVSRNNAYRFENQKVLEMVTSK
jgi:hypothetical protein